MNTPKHTVRPAIKTAVLSVLTAASFSIGQTRVDRSGANDANNRIGSGGVNQVNTSPQPWQISNDIVYGNATGGKEFRGNLSSTDRNAFRGFTAGRGVDNFVRDSAGVTTNGVTSYNANNTTPFYGQSKFAPPPPAFTQVGPAGSYTTPAVSNWTNIDPRQQALGTPAITFSPQNGPGPLNGAVPGVANPDALTSPQPLNPAGLSDYTAIGKDTTTSELSASQVKQMRGAAGQTNPDGATENAGGKAGPVNTSLDSSLNSSDMNATPMSNSVASDSVSNAVTPLGAAEPGMVTRVVGASSDSSTYAGLAKRRGEQEQALRPGQAAEQASTEFNQQMRAKKEAEEKKKAADQPAPGGKAGGMVAPGAAAPKPGDAQTPAERLGHSNAPAPMPAPLKLNSLAAPDKSSGIDSMLTKAEDQMRQGKFATAIDTYEAAEAQAPKNALIKLGMTNAELGGSYYRRAEVSLRQTLSADKNLLAGQYDLRAFMGDDRLAIVQKDLSDLVQKNPGDVNAAVLLAYVYYNTGNERRAAALLDLADKRAAGKDEFVTLLKSSWNLNTPDKADNK